MGKKKPPKKKPRRAEEQLWQRPGFLKQIVTKGTGAW